VGVLLTTKEMAVRTGISQQTIMRLRKSGKIPYMVVRGQVLFSLEDVALFLRWNVTGAKKSFPKQAQTAAYE
jgi:excisionase family DNA binding protein